MPAGLEQTEHFIEQSGNLRNVAHTVAYGGPVGGKVRIAQLADVSGFEMTTRFVQPLATGPFHHFGCDVHARSFTAVELAGQQESNVSGTARQIEDVVV